MMNLSIENYIESQYRRLSDEEITDEYLHLYEAIDHPRLKTILSTLHSEFISSFKSMNSRLPTGHEGGRFWAHNSRKLIKTIEISKGLQKILKNTHLAFNIDEYYQEVISKCDNFLKPSEGSTIPPQMEKIDLYYIIPIFIPQNIISVTNPENNKSFELKLIGEGSYSHVFKYKDEYYQKMFVLKRAKKDLDEKEISRFKREFDQMKNLKSPYIVEVFSYNDKKNEYIMEYMDSTLKNYIESKNSSLNANLRKSIGTQILKAFNYIHSKKLFHRDISPQNVLLKEYDDVVVVKIADFGLVRIPDSNLTTVNTEFKGYFNDPNLVVEGFENYNIFHETYALTRLLYFVMTGKTNADKIAETKLKEFVMKGLHSNKSERFKNVDEMSELFKNI